MMRYFIIFFLIYGGMHAYFIWKVHAGFPEMGRWTWLAGALCVLMMCGPVLVRQLDVADHPAPAGLLADVVFVWMAVVFWFAVLGAAGEGWNVLVRATGLAWPAARAAVIQPRVHVLAAGGLIALATVWSLVDAERIRLRTLEIEAPRMPPGSAPLRIVHISDLHLGTNTGAFRLARILDRVREARPDVLLAGGDLIDSPLENVGDLAAMLRDVQAPLGKLAVTGNHEYYLGLDRALAFHEAAGLRMVRGQTVQVAPGVQIAGVDDPAGLGRLEPCFTDEDPLLPPRGQERPTTILLKHQPRVEDASIGRFDLQLSGHTHGGQIFPFMVVTRLMYPMYRGFHRLGDSGSLLYVNLGAGTWGPPMRLFAPPEVLLVILKPPEAR
jgi:predicted MPP superfamily phosphohydrolase